MQEIKGAGISCAENVYPIAEDTFIAAELLLRNIRGSRLRVIDIGTGTGTLGIIAAMDYRVESAILADISEDALACAKLNAESNGVAYKCSFRKADLFAGTSEYFDIIIFNPPYLPDDEVRSAKNEWSGGTSGTETTKRFAEQAAAHLRPDGLIITVASSFGDSSGLADFIRSKGLAISDSETAHIFFEDITAMALRLRQQIRSQ